MHAFQKPSAQHGAESNKQVYRMMHQNGKVPQINSVGEGGATSRDNSGRICEQGDKSQLRKEIEMSSRMWEFRESAQHPHHVHFKALCHPTQLNVLDAGCDLCKEPTVGMERMSVSQAAEWAALLETGIQLCKSLCLPVRDG